jgi:hypothetical protein
MYEYYKATGDLNFIRDTLPVLETEYEFWESNVHGEVYSIQHYEIKFVSDLRQVRGFLRVFRVPPTIKLTAMIYVAYQHISALKKNICFPTSNFSIGFVPNGGRVYFTRRSQPPFLIQMMYANQTKPSNR